MTKGGAFRLNMAPRVYFDENPYKNDKPLPPAKKAFEKKLDLKPFKPSSPAKLVNCVGYHLIELLKMFNKFIGKIFFHFARADNVPLILPILCRPTPAIC